MSKEIECAAAPRSAQTDSQVIQQNDPCSIAEQGSCACWSLITEAYPEGSGACVDHTAADTDMRCRTAAVYEPDAGTSVPVHTARHRAADMSVGFAAQVFAEHIPADIAASHTAAGTSADTPAAHSRSRTAAEHTGRIRSAGCIRDTPAAVAAADKRTPHAAGCTGTADTPAVAAGWDRNVAEREMYAVDSSAADSRSRRFLLRTACMRALGG